MFLGDETIQLVGGFKHCSSCSTVLNHKNGMMILNDEQFLFWGS